MFVEVFRRSGLPSFIGLLPALLVLGSLSGCGGDAYDTVDISGTVTYEDGSLIPAEQIMVEFNSQQKNLDEKTYPRIGKAEVNVKDGKFDVVSTYNFGDGVIVGEHKVVVKAYQNGAPSHKFFPKTYSDVTTTPLKITVGAEREFPIKLPKAR